MRHKRVIIKLSGELLKGDNAVFDHVVLEKITRQISMLRDNDIQIGIVIGGGNIFRGGKRSEYSIDAIHGDQIGMLATMINGIILRDYLHKSFSTKIYSAFSVAGMFDTFNVQNVLNDIERNVLIFVGGTGNPCFTTDSCAALRAVETQSTLLIKATNIDGIYDADPKVSKFANRYDIISFNKAIQLGLNIMDLAAFDICSTHGVQIFVCNALSGDNISLSVLNQDAAHGTLVH